MTMPGHHSNLKRGYAEFVPRPGRPITAQVSGRGCSAVGILVVAIGKRPIGLFGPVLSAAYRRPIDRPPMGLGLISAPSLGCDDTCDADMPAAVAMAISGHSRGGECRPALRTDRPRPLAHSQSEGEGESDNEHRCGSPHPVTDQNANVNRGDVRVTVKKYNRHNAPLFHSGYHHQND